MDIAGVMTEKQCEMGEDFFFPLRTAGCMEMCPRRCGRFLSGRFPICGAESEIDVAGVLNLSGRICIGACQGIKNKCPY